MHRQPDLFMVLVLIFVLVVIQCIVRGEGRSMRPGRKINSDKTIMTNRMFPLRQHGEQIRFWNSVARFNINHSGRRSGKTELVKRKIVKIAQDPWNKSLPGALRAKSDDPRYFCAAPTWQQAKRIFWSDLLAMIPEWALRHGNKSRDISHAELVIRLRVSEIAVVGLDVPARIEGVPWDGGVLDEYGNIKESVWPEHVRPALSDRKGWCDFIGVPEGRNHYFLLVEKAKEYMAESVPPVWSVFHWHSELVLPPDEIAQAKRDLDQLTYDQEYGGEFVSFQGRIYYPFDPSVHCTTQLKYNPLQPLIFCFDFNVSPGCAVVCQEQVLPGIIKKISVEEQQLKIRNLVGRGIPFIGTMPPLEDIEEPVVGTGVIGEVYIPQDSNTVKICEKLIEEWGDHKGDIYCYGDAAGGARTTSQTEGTDWEIIRRILGRHYGHDRVYIDIPPSNPRERVRINAVNSRLRSVSGDIRILFQKEACKWTILDMEGVRAAEDGSIDKKRDPKLSHLSDALGYYIHRRFPVVEAEIGIVRRFTGERIA
jgi:hypothetical protein